ncbi:hypothetical protein I4U23_027679 [Adineta vaga]|nr:hypothetical protein I4U23_027679 [Adineta vaga]
MNKIEIISTNENVDREQYKINEKKFQSSWNFKYYHYFILFCIMMISGIIIVCLNAPKEKSIQ